MVVMRARRRRVCGRGRRRQASPSTLPGARGASPRRGRLPSPSAPAPPPPHHSLHRAMASGTPSPVPFLPGSQSADPRAVLARYWGYSKFRNCQEVGSG